MDEHYDVIVLGTGLKECILSGLLSVAGKKVLHLDRNKYYGGECASLDIQQLAEKFEKEPLEYTDRQRRDFCIDLVPKFIMADGDLVKTLTKARVLHHLQFTGIDGSYVQKDGKLHKIPTTAKEVLGSKLLKLLEKRRMQKFLNFVQSFDTSKPETTIVPTLKTQASEVTVRQVFESYKMAQSTIDFLGHAMALHTNDDYLNETAVETIEKIKLYALSVFRFEGLTSPYVYPQYGLGDLPQAFARLSAVYGGVYMLRTPVDKILYNQDGTVKGVVTPEGEATCDILIGDPSYFQDSKYVTETGAVVRGIFILDHPIPECTVTKGTIANSFQLIIPQRESGRKNDVYVSLQSDSLKTTTKGTWLGFASTTVETGAPETELAVAERVLGQYKEKYVQVTTTYAPVEGWEKKNVYITSTLDASTHFESTTQEVLDIYATIMGEPLDLDDLPEMEQ